MTMDRRDFLTASGLALLASTALARQAFGQSGKSGSLKEMLDAALSRPVQRGDIPSSQDSRTRTRPPILLPSASGRSGRASR